MKQNSPTKPVDTVGAHSAPRSDVMVRRTKFLEHKAPPLQFAQETVCLSDHFLLLVITVFTAGWAYLEDRGQTLTSQTNEFVALFSLKQQDGVILIKSAH